MQTQVKKTFYIYKGRQGLRLYLSSILNFLLSRREGKNKKVTGGLYPKIQPRSKSLLEEESCYELPVTPPVT